MLGNWGDCAIGIEDILILRCFVHSPDLPTGEWRFLFLFFFKESRGLSELVIDRTTPDLPSAWPAY